MESRNSENIKSMNYIGPSMNPTLMPGDKVRVIPYNGQEIRRGDVIAFIPPGGCSKLIHRVITVDRRGIRTRGDNNKDVDQWALNPDHILGRVASTHRKKRQRKISGGVIGRVFAGRIRIIHRIDACVSNLLRPIYYDLARRGIFRRLLPRWMETRICSFNRPGGTELQLIMGRCVIGRLLPGRARWHIRRPFLLFVDASNLPENPCKLKS